MIIDRSRKARDACPLKTQAAYPGSLENHEAR